MILTGDCIEVMKMMDPGSVDLVIADPPYNIGIDYGSGAKADQRSDYDQWCHKWVQECDRVLKPYGSLWVISGQEHGADIDAAIRMAGMTIRNRITWHETFGVYCHNKFGRCSRPIYYAVKNQKIFTFNRHAVLIPSARAEKYADKRAAPDGMKIMGDVWDFSRVCGTFKERIKGVPTQLPQALVQRIIAVSSHGGDRILDPFAGSGTICAVGTEMGRETVGIEINPQYAEIASQREAAYGTGSPK
jgi:site-specific DNA-methyltransferase (adenine-specific)